jgi:S-adenosylmethionine decarboxylase
MNALGSHLIIEAYNCDSEILDSVPEISRIIYEAVQVSGATPLRSCFHQFSPQGVSGVIIIAESHFTVHTWPENAYAAIDIFTCGNKINQDAAMHYIKKELKAQSIEFKEIKRGDISKTKPNLCSINKNK